MLISIRWHVFEQWRQKGGKFRDLVFIFLFTEEWHDGNLEVNMLNGLTICPYSADKADILVEYDALQTLGMSDR